MRAPGLQQGDPSAEIIDLLDEDSDAFSVRAPTPDPGQDTRWRRWLAPMGGLAVVGLIAYAIASSSSSHRPTAATETTVSTTVPSTTIPRRDVPAAHADVHYYAADPQGYILQSADVASGIGSDDEDSSYSYQRWTVTGESTPPDAWFSIETYPHGGSDPAATANAYRINVDGRAVAISHPDGATTSADFAANSIIDVRVLAVGLSDGDVVRLAGAVTAGGGGVLLDDATAYAGFARTSTVSPWFAIARTPIVQADYGDRQTGGWFSLAVGRIDPEFDGGLQLSDRSSALRHSLVHTTSFSIDGHVAVAGERVDAAGIALVTWMVGDDVITLTGTVPTSELMLIARTVHEVTVTDWQTMIRQAAQNMSLAAQRTPTTHEGTFRQVAAGNYATGEAWSIQAAWATFGDQHYVSWMWPSNSTMLLTSQDPQITDEVDRDHTYMLAALPRSYGSTATLHIDRPGMEPVAVPFIDLGPEFDRTLAAYAFTEPGMFTAWIEADDGSILARWPS